MATYAIGQKLKLKLNYKANVACPKIRSKFNVNEDQIIINWVKANGPINWKACALMIDNKTKIQCRDRWFNVLDPMIISKRFDEIEDFFILRLYLVIGSKWSLISKYLKKRTACQIKNRFYGVIKSSKYKHLKFQSEKAKRLFICEEATHGLSRLISYVLN